MFSTFQSFTMTDEYYYDGFQWHTNPFAHSFQHIVCVIYLYPDDSSKSKFLSTCERDQFTYSIHFMFINNIDSKATLIVVNVETFWKL